MNYDRAQKLTDDLTQSRNDQFGEGTYGCPNKFFNPNVFVIAPDGRPTQRNPKYCATNLGATALVKVFAEAFGALNLVMGLTLKAAMAFSGWGEGEDNPLVAHNWTESEAVPFIAFYSIAPDGTKAVVGSLNAGLMLDLFNHGYPVEQPLRELARELKDALNLNEVPTF